MNMNVSLTEELANFVKAKVSGGRYTSSSEVVREALRLMEKLEQQEAEKLRFLQQAWQQGIDSGDAGEVDFSALKQEARARLAASKEWVREQTSFYTPRARRPTGHLALHRNPHVADQVYDRIEKRCRLLRDHPQLGPARPEIGEGARVLVIERWLALYRLVEDGVQVVRIVDGARDLTRLEWTPE
jgi:antitoxin ParD1/3/4